MSAAKSEAPKVVIDGSNIATEGRTMPSLAQLVAAVTDFAKEYPDHEVIVVVDATFGHRIDESERKEYDDAASHGEIISPPAGAIGRGDAFLLRIADRTGAMVLSNDSFQEFHGEFEWLFDKGRLLGGTPVPGVGWIFTPRSPVRGPKSRESMKEARRKAGNRPAKSKAAKDAAPAKGPGRGRGKGEGKGEPVEKAVAKATDEAEKPKSGGRRGRGRGRSKGPSEPVNDPIPFIDFVGKHPPGSEVEGEVESFSSHGAFIEVEGLHCYIPLSAMSDPPPRSARELLKKGEPHRFVIQAYDPPRRGVELAIPGFAHVSGQPTEETVDAEITEAPKKRRSSSKAKASAKAGKADDMADGMADDIPPLGEPLPRSQAKAGPGRASRKDKVDEPTPAAPKKAPAKKAPAKKAASTKATAKKATAKKATAKKATAKKASAKKAPAKKATATKGSAKKATATKGSAKKAPARKATAKKASAKKAATKATAKKATAKKSAAKKSATKKG